MREFEALDDDEGRPFIPPERLIRASLLQTLLSIRAKRQLMERIDCNLRSCLCFVRLGVDDRVWVPTVFTKHRDRLQITAILRDLRTLSPRAFCATATKIVALWLPAPHA
jgi:hypothetical protein